jgi:integrase
MGTTYQRGYVTPRGKQWYGYYRKVVNDPDTNEQKSVRVPVNFGHKSKMTKTEARQALEREITKQLGQPGSPTRIMNDGSVTLGWFVNNRFIPLKEGVWKEKTAENKKLLIQLDIVEPLGDIPLVNHEKFSLQLHLNKLAETRSKDRVLQMRAYIRDIFAEAVDQDFLVKDPARKLKVPAQLRPTDTTTLTWDQLRAALSKLGLRDRILLELDMTNALRPSELFAFRWRRFDYQACTLVVAETAYKGSIRDWGKTKKSLTVIHIPQRLANDLEAWRLECEAKAREAFSKSKRESAELSPNDFMFENEVGGVLDTDNYRKRVLHKIARELELPKLTFQVIRRTIATLAQKKGTVKDVQGVLRHSRAATTSDVYMQEIPESVQAPINSINQELRKSGESNRASRKKLAAPGARVSSRRKTSKSLTQNDTNSLIGGSRLLPASA